MNSLSALAAGSHNLAFCQREKYQLPFVTSGLRRFRKWSSGESNVIQTGTLQCQISSHSPSLRSVWSPSLSTVANCRIGHREQQFCQSTTIGGLERRGYRVTKCTCKRNPYEEYLDRLLEELAKPNKNSNHDQLGGKRKNGPFVSDDSRSIKQKTEGKSDKGASKAADPLHQNTAENPQLSEWIEAVTKLSSDLAVNVDLEMKADEEHVLKIKRVPSSLTEKDKVERAKQMAQKAAVLLLYGNMLLDMANKWRAQSKGYLSNENE